MSIANGFNHFLAWKPQTAHGTKATGLTKTMVPIRSGGMFDAASYRRSRGTVVQAIPKVSNLFTVAKTGGFAFDLELVSPTSGHDTVRDFLKTALGKEVTAVGPPVTKTMTIGDLIDGGVDGTPANTNYGRSLTLHEQADRSDGVAIFAHEMQDAVVDTLAIVFEPEQVTRIRVSGQASDLQDDQTDITPADPTGPIHTWAEMRNTTNSGLRIGTANPPVQADNVVHQRATLTLRNSIRYIPFLGESALQQVRIPVRGDVLDIELEIMTDVEDAIASQEDTKDIVDQWVAGTSLNCKLLSYLSVNDIFEFSVTAAIAGMIVDRFRFETPNAGPMQATAVFKAYPNSLADLIYKLTSLT